MKDITVDCSSVQEAACALYEALTDEARGWASDDADDQAVLQQVEELPAAQALDALAHSSLLPSNLCSAIIDALVVMDPDTYELSTSPVPDTDRQPSKPERQPRRYTATEATAACDGAAALRPLLDALEPEMLTAIRTTVAGAEEAAWQHVIARRVHAIAPGPYAVAVFTAKWTLGMGHADYRPRNVELYGEAEDHDEPDETLDFDDAVLWRALGALAELRRPSEGAELEVDLAQGDEAN